MDDGMVDRSVQFHSAESFLKGGIWVNDALYQMFSSVKIVLCYECLMDCVDSLDPKNRLAQKHGEEYVLNGQQGLAITVTGCGVQLKDEWFFCNKCVFGARNSHLYQIVEDDDDVVRRHYEARMPIIQQFVRQRFGDDGFPLYVFEADKDRPIHFRPIVTSHTGIMDKKTRVLDCEVTELPGIFSGETYFQFRKHAKKGFCWEANPKNWSTSMEVRPVADDTFELHTPNCAYRDDKADELVRAPPMIETSTSWIVMPPMYRKYQGDDPHFIIPKEHSAGLSK